MGNPAIFSGKRTKLLTTKGILNSDTSINDNDGLINYIKNGHAEVNALGWATYADVAGVLPVDGTGGTPTHITFTQTTTTPLGGLGSFLITNSGSTSAQGEGASYNFTIDAKDKAKVLQISFDYIVNSGTFVAGSTGVDSDVEVYIYDVTNSVLIQPSSYKLLSNSTTIADKFNATFQTASNSTSYRLIFHCPTAATSAWALKLDNIAVSPSQYVYGTPITDWKEFVVTAGPTGTIRASTTAPTFGTVALNKAMYRRVGSNAEIIWTFKQTTVGTAGSGGYYFDISQLGLQIDTTNLPANSSFVNWSDFQSSVGEFVWADGTATGGIVAGSVHVASATQLKAIGQYQGPTATQGSWSATFGPFSSSLFTTTLRFSVPILGWGASTQMSDSAALNVVAALVSGSTTSLPGSSITKITYPTTNFDTSSAWSSVNNRYICPIAGYYQLNVPLAINQTALANFLFSTFVYKNGSNFATIGTGYNTNIVGQSSVPMANSPVIVQCNAGDYLEIFVNNPNATTTAVTFSELSISRLSGPSAIAATEEISLSYINGAGTSIANGGTGFAISGWTKVFDTHGSFNPTTSIFTAPAAGRYAISGSIAFTGGSYPTNSEYAILCQQLGSATTFTRLGTITLPVAVTITPAVIGKEFIFNCNAGDTISFYAYQASGVARSLSTDTSFNTISIKRVK